MQGYGELSGQATTFSKMPGLRKTSDARLASEEMAASLRPLLCWPQHAPAWWLLTLWPPPQSKIHHTLPSPQFRVIIILNCADTRLVCWHRSLRFLCRCTSSFNFSHWTLPSTVRQQNCAIWSYNIFVRFPARPPDHQQYEETGKYFTPC